MCIAEPVQFDYGTLRRFCPGKMFSIVPHPAPAILARLVVLDQDYVTYETEVQEAQWPRHLRDAFSLWLRARHDWTPVFYFSDGALPTYDFTDT